MNSSFLLAACLIMVAAAAPLMIALLGRGSGNPAGNEARRARTALAAARAAGVLSQDEYDAKLAALPAVEAHAAAPVAKRLAIALAVLLPACALALYARFGDPRALDPAALTQAAQPADDAAAPDLATALAGLEARLQANPDDTEGWALLVRGYQSAQQFDKALAAMRKLRDLMPGDLDTQVGYAEALALASPDRAIEGEASALIADALQRDPAHQRALWLAGIEGMQRSDTATALKHWRKLEALLPEGSEVRASLAQQIRSAEGTGEDAVAQSDPPAAAADTGDTAPEPVPATTGASITVSIRLDPSLAAQVSPDDTLFVFARAASGPRMPLAIKRLRAADLPVTVTLDDSMSMMPEMNLSKFPQIVIGARISKSGNAIAGSGDLQALTEAIDRAAIKDHVQITIDEVVP